MGRLEAISGYQLSNENYVAVVEVLKKRFGNPQLIIDTHYQHVPPATNHVLKLRQCYDSIERHLRSLEAVGENTNHRHFVSMILDKLPQRVRCQLYMQKPDGEEWTTSSLRQLLGKYISAMEMAGGDSHDNPRPTSNPPLRLRLPQHRSAEGLLAAGNRQNPQPKCIYCGQIHWSDECPQYKTLQSRKEKLKGCCYNCLKKGHSLKDCTRDRACAHCGKKKSHHRSLCNNLFRQQSTERNAEQTTETQNVSVNEGNDTALVASSSQVIVQTATVMVKGLQNEATKIRLILDSGSQRSYITEQVASRLKLPELIEKISVVTFGTNKPKTINCKLSNVRVCLKDKTFMTMKVTVVPHITGKINRVPMKAKDIEFLHKEFSHGLLADTVLCHPESTAIDMLVGSDYYFDLLEPCKMDLGGGLYLFNSKLGWILGG